ncbi:MAG TPA: WhiB family transcriptional regulator, partial [Acidimicrobiales bacterium]|nr:WhiB family transcriptional regulator [Acidimicrobiales bacterium]
MCFGVVGVSFFPTRNEAGTKAKAVCARCLVSSECLDFAPALDRRLDGIWGGTTQAQRVQILRHQGRGPRKGPQCAQGSVALADRVRHREGVGMNHRRRQVAPLVPELSAFAGFRFPPEVILL